MPTPRRPRTADAPPSAAPTRVSAPVPALAAPRPRKSKAQPLPLQAVTDALRAALPAFGSEQARTRAAEMLEALVPVFHAAPGPIPQQIGRRMFRLSRALRLDNPTAAQYSYDKVKERLALLVNPPAAPAHAP